MGDAKGKPVQGPLRRGGSWRRWQLLGHVGFVRNRHNRRGHVARREEKKGNLPRAFPLSQGTS